MPAKAVIFSLQQAYLVWAVGTGGAWGRGVKSALQILKPIVAKYLYSKGLVLHFASRE